jgi:hypothetical protein
LGNKAFKERKTIMKKMILVLFGITLISVSVTSQTLVVYSDAEDSLKAEWSHGGTFSRAATGGFEGVKCQDWSYQTENNGWLGDTLELGLKSPPGTPYVEWIPAKQYKYVQFAIKASNPENISKTEFSFWCMHCLIPDANLHFKERQTINLTTSWQVISYPMEIWAANPLDKISVFTFWFMPNKSAATKEGHIYFDDFKFTNTEVGVTPSPHHNSPRAAAQMAIVKGGKIKIDVFSLNGVAVSSSIVDVAANTHFQASRYVAKELRPGAYVVRQSAFNGATIAKFEAEQIVVVRR